MDWIQGITTSLIATLIFILFSNRKKILLYIYAYIFWRKKRIRISFIALLKVKKDEKYLLIRNLNRPDSYAPIGGAYKYFPNADGFFDTIKFEPQKGKSKLNDLKKDIRGILPFYNLFKFIKWFELGQNRELDCIGRELKEELEEINKNQLITNLDNPTFHLIRTAHDGPHKIEGYDYLQYSIFNVYEFSPDYLTRVNAINILHEASKKSSKLIFVTSDDIYKNRTNKGFTIGTNCGFIIGNKRTGPYPAPSRLNSN